MPIKPMFICLNSKLVSYTSSRRIVEASSFLLAFDGLLVLSENTPGFFGDVIYSIQFCLKMNCHNKESAIVQ